VLKVIVDFIAMLIGAEGAKTPAESEAPGAGNQQPSLTQPFFKKK
jgi:hypothetical protein